MKRKHVRYYVKSIAVLVFAVALFTVVCADTAFSEGGRIQSSVYSVDRENGRLKGISVGTTVDQFKANLTNDSASISIYDGSGKQYAGSLVATGMSAKLMSGSTVEDELQLVVSGDANGDGKVNITDYTRARLCILGLKPLTQGVF